MEPNRLLKNRKERIYACKQSLPLFFSIYFGEYITKEMASFQNEMMQLVQHSLKYLVILAFRGSGKSTILSTCYPIWAIVSEQKKKFVLIVTQTQDQAKQMCKNIRQELENNQVLVKDFGAFYQSDEEWKNNSLILPKYKAKIMAVSRDQSIRGLRFGAHRPDLIIVDDIEDLDSAKTYEGRKKVYDIFKGEIVPMADINNCQFIVLGNLVHADCLVMRLIEEMNKHNLPGMYRTYPIADNFGIPLWRGMFLNSEALKKKELEINDYVTWNREYLLKIVDEPDQIILPEWISRYSELPNKGLILTATSIDPASSDNTTSCYTAMVSFKIYKDEDGKATLYVLPNPINQRLRYPSIIDTANKISKELGDGMPTTIYVESAGQQGGLIDLMEERGLLVEGVKIGGIDKKTRLKNISPYIKDGRILFPEHGAEALISQLIYFGKENNDLCDALTLIAQKLINEYSQPISKITISPIGLFDGGQQEEFETFEDGRL